MTVLSYTDYQSKLAGLPEENFIGHLCYYTVNSGGVTSDDMRRLLVAHNIPERYMPSEIRAEDAFRKATNLRFEYTQRTEYPTPWLGAERVARIMIRDVNFDKDMIEKHIVRENVNTDGKTLSYDKIGEAIFYKPIKNGTKVAAGTEKVRFNLLPQMLHPDEVDAVSAIIDHVRERYANFSTYLDGNALRKVVRDFITDLNAVSVKTSGGIYFVHKDRHASVEAVAALVGDFANGSKFHTLPLIDTGEQREMLSEAFQSQVESEVSDLLQEIAAVNERYGSEVPPAKHAALVAKYDELMTRSAEYTQILESTQGRAALALEMAMTATWDMATRVKQAS